MRVTAIPVTLVSLLVVSTQPAQLTPTQAAATQTVPWHPCARITAACTRAGFAHYGAKMGFGMAVDCIRPIMFGTPQRKQATKALPQIDPQVVAACRKRDPNFGRGGRAKSQIDRTGDTKTVEHVEEPRRLSIQRSRLVQAPRPEYRS